MLCMLKREEGFANPRKDGLFHYVGVIINVKASSVRRLDGAFNATTCKSIR